MTHPYYDYIMYGFAIVGIALFVVAFLFRRTNWLYNGEAVAAIISVAPTENPAWPEATVQFKDETGQTIMTSLPIPKGQAVVGGKILLHYIQGTPMQVLSDARLRKNNLAFIIVGNIACLFIGIAIIMFSESFP